MHSLNLCQSRSKGKHSSEYKIFASKLSPDDGPKYREFPRTRAAGFWLEEVSKLAHLATVPPEIKTTSNVSEDILK